MEKFLLFEIIGVFVIFILGSLFHFLYKYCGRKIWLAIISPVNESIWEHLKIAFYPYLLYSTVEFLILDDSTDSFWFAKALGVTAVILVILIVELIYPKVVGRNVLVIDLVIFFVAILLGQVVSYFLIRDSILSVEISISLLILISISVCLSYLTFFPPKLDMFRDSITGSYGIRRGK